MKQQYILFLPLLVAAAAPSPRPSHGREPCALLSDQFNSLTETELRSQTAYDCLQSIPYDRKRSIALLDELDKYVQFQSTLEALKNPPKTYLSPPVDILGDLEKARSREFSSQYEFDLAVHNIVRSANDGHFRVELCTLSLFGFSRSALGTLVSFSSDGFKVPSIYTLPDALSLHRNSTVKVSNVVTINGQNVTEILGSTSVLLSKHDPDARYNDLFWSKSLGTNGAFSSDYSIDIQTFVQILPEHFNVTDGQDLLEQHCVRKSSSLKEEPKPLPRPSNISGPKGYPTPFLRDPYNEMIGFNLDNETAVMFIPTFIRHDTPYNQSVTVSDIASKIVHEALAHGRKKIIIDVTGNGGGIPSRGLDLFKLFFPDKFPYSAIRFRRHTISDAAVYAFSIPNEDRHIPGWSSFDWKDQVHPNQDFDFESPDDFLGNKEQLGVNVSSLSAAFNYTSASLRDYTPIRGYAGRPLNKSQPYKPEDILIVGDGFCASACAMFVNLMTNVGGVRSVVFGGRPRLEPMQIMGGTRGGAIVLMQDLSLLGEYTALVYKKFPLPLPVKKLAQILDRIPRPVEEFPFMGPRMSINLRNTYQESNDDLPLQFQYQAADCRLFFTLENILSPSSVWGSAKNAIWGGGKCVEGSTGGKGSLEYKKKHNGTIKERESETPENSGGNKSAAETITIAWGTLGTSLLMCAAMVV